MWNLLIKALKRRLYDTWIDLKNFLISPTYTIGLISKRGGWGLTVVIMLLVLMLGVVMSLFMQAPPVDDEWRPEFRRWWPLRDSCIFLAEFWLIAIFCHALLKLARRKIPLTSLLRVWGISVLPLLFRLILYCSAILIIMLSSPDRLPLAIFAPVLILSLGAITWQVFTQARCVNLVYKMPMFLSSIIVIAGLSLVTMIDSLWIPHSRHVYTSHWEKREVLTPSEEYDIEASKIVDSELEDLHLEQTKNGVCFTLMKAFIRPTEIYSSEKKKASYLELELEFPHKLVNSGKWDWCRHFPVDEKLEDDLGNQYYAVCVHSNSSKNKVRIEYYFPAVDKEANFVYYEGNFQVHELEHDVIISDAELALGEEITLGKFVSDDEVSITFHKIRAELQKEGNTKVYIDYTRNGTSDWPFTVSIYTTDANTGEKKIYTTTSVRKVATGVKTRTWDWTPLHETGEKISETEWTITSQKKEDRLFDFDIGKYVRGKVTIYYISGKKRKAASEKFRLGPIPVHHMAQNE